MYSDRKLLRFLPQRAADVDVEESVRGYRMIQLVLATLALVLLLP